VTPGRSLTPALRGLRAYWGTAVLLAGAGAGAIAVLAPAMALVAPHGASQPARLALPPAGGLDFGLVWSTVVRSPDALRAAAVAGLSRLLLGVALGVIAVSWLTTLSLSAAASSARAPEMAIRRAVGATRLQLLLTALLEGGVTTVAALTVGGAVGLVGVRLALGAWPGAARPAALPAVAAALATVAGIGLGALLPLVRARRRANLAVAEETPLVLAIPALQLGLSLSVLVAATLLDRGAAVEPAHQAAGEGGAVYTIAMRDAAPAARAAAYGALLGELEAGDGPGEASLGGPGTTTGLGPVDVVMTDCGACSWGGLPYPWHVFRGAYYLASADTFHALGLPLLAGRGFTDRDTWGSAPVAVVSRSLARRHYEAAGAVGRGILVGHGTDSLYTVVGVVADRTPAAFGSGLESAEAVYLPVLQHPPRTVELLVRGGPARPGVTVGAAVRRALGSRVERVEGVSEGTLLASEAAPRAWFGAMFAGEGWAMLLIGIVGTFAVMWLWVASLAGELGVRRAVGARRRDVIAHVLVRAAAVVGAGVAFALWVGTMLWDAVQASVAGLPAWDPAVVWHYGALLAAAAFAGAVLPAWRAARTAPARLVAARL
jgi:putative ABC transport system permease protein